jgi:NADPH2:quinone reductase
VLGLDVAGAIEELGPGVAAFRKGDPVYGMVGGVGGLHGTLAEFVIANWRLLAPKPESLSMREAAALPLVTITAWEGIVDRAHVQAGQKVLVHAGAGGVGYIAAQPAQKVKSLSICRDAGAGTSLLDKSKIRGAEAAQVGKDRP